MVQHNRPNVVCIMPDDTDYVWLSCYGGRTPTPHIDSIARHGARFDAMYCSASACTPSRYSYLTGHYAGRCPDPHFLAENPPDEPYLVAWNTVLNASIPSLPGVLKENGYRTGISGKWHAGRPTKELNLPNFNPDDDPDDPDIDAKLHVYQQVLVDEVKHTAGFDYAASIVWGNNESFPVKKLREHNVEWTTQGALDFLDGCDTSQPFFLYVTPTAFHGPPHDASYVSNPAYTQGGKIAVPAGGHPQRSEMHKRLAARNLPFNHDTVGITWIDDQVGVILDKLKSMKVLDNTIVIFKVDHNTEPGKGTCHQHGIQIPFIMRWSGHIEPNIVVTARGMNVDFVPTILDCCKITPPQEMVLDGASLLPVLTGAIKEVHDALFFEFGYTRAVLAGKWKYIALRYPQRLIAGMENGECLEAPNHINQRLQGQMNVAIECYPAYFDPDQLFDVEVDPDEQHNLANDPAYAETLARMRQLLSAFVKTFDHPFDLEVPEFMKTTQYQALCEKTREIGTEYLYWWPKERWW